MEAAAGQPSWFGRTELRCVWGMMKVLLPYDDRMKVLWAAACCRMDPGALQRALRSGAVWLLENMASGTRRPDREHPSLSNPGKHSCYPAHA